MKERPILFSAPMVRALLAGTKTQTRRMMKNPPIWNTEYQPNGWQWIGKNPGEPALTKWPDAAKIGREIAIRATCPYGQPGDRLWVREAWGLHAYGDDTDWLKGSCTELDLDDHVIAYRADWGPLQDSCHWRPSIHMPRAASRITLEVTGVRVERLQDISEADAQAEGARECDPVSGREVLLAGPSQRGSFRLHYRDIWESINGPESWAANPWVWVVEFKRVEATHG